MFDKNNLNVKKVSIDDLMRLDQSLTDCNFRQTGHDSMDDFHPYTIFSGRALKESIKHKNWAAALYLLPMCCINRILRDKEANRKLRTYWAYIAMFIMIFYWSNLKLECQKRSREAKKEDFDSIFTINLCVDCINAMYAILFGISSINEECSISRIVTILSEHFFASLRYKSGKDQSLKSLKWAFERILQMKKWGSFDQNIIERRIFETGIMEEGVYIPEEDEVEKCRMLTIKFFILSEQVFPKEGAAYFMQWHPNDLDLTFNEWEENILNSLSNKSSFKSMSKKTGEERSFSWEINVSRYRLTSRVGRNITSRYHTKVK